MEQEKLLTSKHLTADRIDKKGELPHAYISLNEFPGGWRTETRERR